MADQMIVRSYRRVFRVDRRIYRVDGWALRGDGAREAVGVELVCVHAVPRIA